VAQPYIGEIRMFAGNFAPDGWAFCDGQVLPISGNDTLFNLIGTTYGGDGQDTFALPDLRGRLPIHQGNGFILAETGGAEEITLTVNQIPAHTHPLLGTDDTATQANPGGNVHARFSQANIYPYIEDVPNQNMSPNAIAPVGGSQPHTNFQPYLCVNYIIAMTGIFPSQT
jgi:microcystin-dependent protein